MPGTVPDPDTTVMSRMIPSAPEPTKLRVCMVGELDVNENNMPRSWPDIWEGQFDCLKICPQHAP